MHVHVILPHADHPTCLSAATDSSSAPALSVCLGAEQGLCGMQPPPVHISADWNIIQACGIFAVSVSGHSSLPVLRNSMATPQVNFTSTSSQCCRLQITSMLSLLIHLTAGLIRPEASQPFSLHGHTSLHSLHQLAEQS